VGEFAQTALVHQRLLQLQPARLEQARQWSAMGRKVAESGIGSSKRSGRKKTTEATANSPDNGATPAVTGNTRRQSKQRKEKTLPPEE
jgi:hypothetical protein